MHSSESAVPKSRLHMHKGRLKTNLVSGTRMIPPHIFGNNPFQFSPNQRTGKGEAKIQKRDHGPDLKGHIGGGHEFLSLKRQFANGNSRNNGRILDG